MKRRRTVVEQNNVEYSLPPSLSFILIHFDESASISVGLLTLFIIYNHTKGFILNFSIACLDGSFTNRGIDVRTDNLIRFPFLFVFACQYLTFHRKLDLRTVHRLRSTLLIVAKEKKKFMVSCKYHDDQTCVYMSVTLINTLNVLDKSCCLQKIVICIQLNRFSTIF